MIGPDELDIRPLTRAQAESLLTWRYPSPYDFYNPPPESDGVVDNLLDAKWHFHGVSQQDNFIGYASYGEDGQLPGGHYVDDALDIGLGLRPDLIGQGFGIVFAGAIFDFAIERFDPIALRLTVAEFNARALHLYLKLGFEEQAAFWHNRTRYRILTGRHRGASLAKA